MKTTYKQLVSFVNKRCQKKMARANLKKKSGGMDAGQLVEKDKNNDKADDKPAQPEDPLPITMLSKEKGGEGA